MKRQALLIGNLDAEGSIIDINNWKRYLQSGIGGAWKGEEIEVLNNPSKLELQNLIDSIKRDWNDYLLVMETGIAQPIFILTHRESILRKVRYKI